MPMHVNNACIFKIFNPEFLEIGGWRICEHKDDGMSVSYSWNLTITNKKEFLNRNMTWI